MTRSRFFNGMLKVFEPRALNHYTLFRPILLILSAPRNPPFNSSFSLLIPEFSALRYYHTHSRFVIFFLDDSHVSGGIIILLLLLIARPLARNGSMAEDHGAPEAGQLPKAWTRDRETESRQIVSGAESP